MKTMTDSLAIVLSLCLLVLNGCGLIIQPKLVANGELKGVPTFDPNSYNLSIHYERIEFDDGAEGYKLEVDDSSSVRIYQTETTPIKYMIAADKAIGKCKINNHTYPVLFDTGNPKLAHITAAHVRQNHLPIYPLTFTTSKGQVLEFGIAMIEELKIGDLMISNLPSAYDYYHTGYLPFGIPVIELGQDKEINIPLSVMQQFKYIAFDNIKKQMEFSLNDGFAATTPENWKSYPLYTTEDNRLYIESTLEGVPVKLIVDTGAGADLLLTKDCFDKMIENQPTLEKAWKLQKAGFAPLVGGHFPYQARLAWGLRFDACKHRFSTYIAVTQNGVIHDLLMKEQFDGIIGFPFFEDTIMVLDFERSKMWVKKATYSRFEK